jgi:hypothetical protein
MNPKILTYGFMMFLICLLVHIFLWRIKIPKKDALTLLLIFIIIPALGLFALFGIKILGFRFPLSGLELLYTFFLHLSLSFVYISSYPAAQADSPSLYILLMIASSGRNGMTAEEIINMSSNTKLITDRVDDLLNYKLISEGKDCFKLRPIARAIIIFFIWYRKLLGLPHYGG